MKKLQIAGAAAGITALAGLVTAVHGSHSTSTAISRNDTPIVVNRPHAANGSPLPVTVTQAPNGGPPIVIVGHGAPSPCPTLTASPSAVPSPSPTPSDCY